MVIAENGRCFRVIFQNMKILPNGVSNSLPPISFAVYPAVDVACFILEKLEDN